MPTSSWYRIQRGAFVGILLCAVLGLVAAVGLLPLPRGSAVLVWLLHPVLFAVGAWCGWAVVARSREIDRELWQELGDPSLSKGEREYAHREAEDRRKAAGTVFLLAAMAPGGLAAYQLRAPDRITAGDLLMVTPILGLLWGLFLANRRLPPVEPDY
jgi:hypothetical protein